MPIPRIRKLLFFGAGAFACVLTMVALVEPNRILIGMLCGDDFFAWRPTRYWRAVLKREGEAAQLSDETLAAFKWKATGVPVLVACARDPDVSVRRPAIVLLGGLARHHTLAALPALREALKDNDNAVRLEAIVALGNLGANAMSASPDLAAQLKGPDLAVRFMAEKALWFANKKMAIAEGGWRTFESPGWGFVASFPAAPVEEQKPSLFFPDQLTNFTFSANHGATSCIVAVTEYPPELFKGTDEERLDAGRDLLALGLDTKHVEEKPIQLGPIKGREFRAQKTIEGNTYIIRNRVFWVQRRLYQVQATYSEELSVLPAVDHFLESFEIR